MEWLPDWGGQITACHICISLWNQSGIIHITGSCFYDPFNAVVYDTMQIVAHQHTFASATNTMRSCVAITRGSFTMSQCADQIQAVHDIVKDPQVIDLGKKRGHGQ